VEVVKALLRLLSYMFHVLLCVWLFALALLALFAGAPALHLAMLPWTGLTLLYILLFGSLVGLVIVISALSGHARWLFFLWSLVIAGMVIKSYFLSGYHFNPGEAKTALYLTVGSLIALLGSWFVMTRRSKAR
jgi:hypothetical protein